MRQKVIRVLAYSLGLVGQNWFLLNETKGNWVLAYSLGLVGQDWFLLNETKGN